MAHVHAMVIVSQTVGRHGAVCEREGERRTDYAKCIQHGKNKCRPHAQSFRQSPQHLRLFWTSLPSTPSINPCLALAKHLSPYLTGVI